jgi:peptidoglycan/LPS O-acetylase OafA/YrhL
MFAVGVNDPNTPHAYVPAIIGTLLTSGWVGQAAVIPVLWTLSAEIGFYILLGIIAATRQGPLGMGRICAAGLVTLFFIWLGASPVSVRSLSWHPHCAGLPLSRFMSVTC